jgi:hypothetical protein
MVVMDSRELVSYGCAAVVVEAGIQVIGAAGSNPGPVTPRRPTTTASACSPAVYSVRCRHRSAFA